MVFTLIIIEIFLRINVKESVNKITYLANRPWLGLPPNGIPDIPNKHDGFIQYDSLLGWSLKPNNSFDGKYFINSQGFRVTESQFLKDNYIKSEINILTIGCSMTEGYNVKCENSWPYLLEEKTGLTVANIGTRGFGLDQMVLSYINCRANTEKVIMGIIFDSYERATKIVRHGVMGNGKISKPLFRNNTITGTLEIVNQPPIKGKDLLNDYLLREKSKILSLEPDFHPWLVKKHSFDFFYIFRFLKMIPLQITYRKEKIYKKNIENDSIIFKLFELFKKTIDKRNHEALIVLMGPDEVYNKSYPNNWLNTKIILKKLDLEYLDISEKTHKEAFNNKSSIYLDIAGHHTNLGNDRVAEAISSSNFIK